MLIGILHYHLRGGGVTRVIEATVSLLKEHGHEPIVVCGEEPEQDIGRFVTHEALRYNVTPEEDRIPSIAEELNQKIKKKCGRTPDLWHVHNHSLGKNTTVPMLVSYWASQQIPLLLQIHDFAEDGRAANYQFLSKNLEDTSVMPLYPQASHIHYATLTQRDRHIFAYSGIKADHLHVLPNPVSMEQDGKWNKQARSLFPDCETLVLYPVRGIRRKNLGEMLLHSIIADPGTHFAMTLAPKNPDQLNRYKQWVQFAQANKLPVSFEAGHQQRYPFPALVRAADLLMTTSITEGFGLTFLEAWLMNRPLCGRDLPDITEDFKENDISLDHLYPSLPISLDWFPVDHFMEKTEEALKLTYQQYGRTYRTEHLQKFKKTVVRNEKVDFGRLDEDLQKIVLEKLMNDTDAREKLQPYVLQHNLPDDNMVERNRKLVNKHYSPDAFYNRIISIYETLTQTVAGEVSYIKPEYILDQFLKPERYFPLKAD